jgi:hypothetical protein
MSVEDVKSKKGEASTEPVIKRVKSPKRPKTHNKVGYGKFKSTIVMKDASGKLVRVNRDNAIARIEQGWVPMSKTKYREALAAGAADIVAVEVVKSKKKK